MKSRGKNYGSIDILEPAPGDVDVFDNGTYVKVSAGPELPESYVEAEAFDGSGSMGRTQLYRIGTTNNYQGCIGAPLGTFRIRAYATWSGTERSDEDGDFNGVLNTSGSCQLAVVKGNGKVVRKPSRTKSPPARSTRAVASRRTDKQAAKGNRAATRSRAAGEKKAAGKKTATKKTAVKKTAKVAKRKASARKLTKR